MADDRFRSIQLESAPTPPEPTRESGWNDGRDRCHGPHERIRSDRTNGNPPCVRRETEVDNCRTRRSSGRLTAISCVAARPCTAVPVRKAARPIGHIEGVSLQAYERKARVVRSVKPPDTGPVTVSTEFTGGSLSRSRRVFDVVERVRSPLRSRGSRSRGSVGVPPRLGARRAVRSGVERDPEATHRDRQNS